MPDYAARTGGFYAALSIYQGDWHLASTRRGIGAVAPAIGGFRAMHRRRDGSGDGRQRLKALNSFDE